MAKRKGVGRGLEVYEVALIKNMRARRMARDFIMSLILWPGRVVSPAAVDEIGKGKIGPDIDAATDAETDTFIQRRLAGSRPANKHDLGGPTSQTVVGEVLRSATKSQALFEAFESRSVEFKVGLPATREERGAIARTMAAYANAGGGYVFFGIEDDRTVRGLDRPEAFSRVCDQVSDIATNCFSPPIEWQKSIVAFRGKPIGVVYVQPIAAAAKPVVAMSETSGIVKSTVYYRYEGKSQRIEPGDLLHLLRERDRAVAASFSVRRVRSA